MLSKPFSKLIKTDQHTLKLFLIAALIFVIQLFVSPWDTYDMEADAAYTFGVSPWVFKVFVPIFLPIVSSVVEICSVFYEYGVVMTKTFSNGIYTGTGAIYVLFFYAVVIRLIERIHRELHGRNEAWYVVCLDMVFLEYIIMFVFNLLSYELMSLLLPINASNGSWKYILCAIALFVAVFFFMVFVFDFIYLAIGVVISVGIPYVVMKMVSNETLGNIVFVLLMIILGGVVWRRISDKVYYYLSNFFSEFFSPGIDILNKIVGEWIY